MTRRRFSEFNDIQDERQQDKINDNKRLSRRSEQKNSESIDMNESDKTIHIKDTDYEDFDNDSNAKTNTHSSTQHNTHSNANTKARSSTKASGKCVYWS